MRHCRVFPAVTAVFVTGLIASNIIAVKLAAFGPLFLPGAALGQLILTQWLFKSAYEAVATPLTYAVVNYLKRAEDEYYFDRATSFNPLLLT